MKKRFLSTLLAAAMVFTMLPVSAMADDTESNQQISVDSTEVPSTAETAEAAGDVAPVEVPSEQTAPVPASYSPYEVEAAPLTSTVDGAVNDNAELFDGYLLQQAYGDIATFATKAGDRLVGESRRVYDALGAEIKSIAQNGNSASVTIPGPDSERVFTEEELGVPILETDPDTGKKYVSSAACKKAMELIGFDASAVFNALLVDYPYDLYWFDKTKGYSYSYPITASINNYTGEASLKIKAGTELGYKYSFTVAQAYRQDGDANIVNATLAQGTQAVVQKAQNIVAEAASQNLNAYDKLKFYTDKICALTDYNSDAAKNDSTPYGDPWQLIWVFDEEPSTKVVCEGYSKAFQYLCDLSAFESEKIESYIVTGLMGGGTGAGRHMWNIVTREDGKNYLVDVTNCDEGTIGHPDHLFLAGPDSGTVDTQYSFTVGFQTIKYQYDDKTRATYTTQDLTLAGDPTAGETTYSLEDAEVTLSPASYVYDGTEKKPTITVVYGDTTLQENTEYTVTFENNKNAGTATAIVTGKGNYTGTVTKGFTINPKEITLNWANTEGRVYGDGKTVTAKIPADALAAGDTVTVTVTNGDKTDAGTTTATAALDGAAKDNYKLINGEQEYTIAPKPVTLTGASIKAKQYDGTKAAEVTTVTFKDSTGTQVTVPSTAYTATAAFDDPNAGTGKTVTVTVTLNDSNYTLADPTLNLTTGVINKASIGAKTGTIQVTNNRAAAAYTFNLMDLLPALDGDKSYGTTTFTQSTPNITGTEYLSASDITTNGSTLTVNVKKVATEAEKEIATVTYSIETQNYTVSTNAVVTVKAVNKKVAAVTAPTAESDLTYDGNPHTGYTGTPSVTGGYTGALEVTYTDKDGNTSTEAPVNAGTYTVTFKVPDSDPEYAGFATVEFTIAPKTLTDAMVADITGTFVYDGTAKTPDVTVTDGNLLTANDYTVTYQNNIDASPATTRSTGATVEVTGKNNYTGTVTKEFTINPKEITLNWANADNRVYGDGKTVTAEIPANTLAAGDTVTVTVTNGDKTAAGTTTATAALEGAAKGNYKLTNGEQEYTIAAKTLTAAMVADITGTFVYDGTAKTPDVTVTDGNLLTANDYTVTYQNNIDASPATAVVTGKGNYTGTVTKGFTINPKEITLNWANADNRVYGDGKTVTAEIPADALVTGDTVTVTVTNGDKTDAGTTTATAALDGAAKDNYKLTNSEQNYTLAAKTLTDAMVAEITDTFIYDGTAKTPDVTVTDGNLLTANDYTVTYENNKNVGTATAIVTGKGNYIDTVTKEFTITPQPVTLTGGSVNAKQYDGTTDATVNIVSFADSNGNPITVPYTATAKFADPNAGSNKTVTVTVTLSDANYSLADPTLTLTNGVINKASIAAKTGTIQVTNNCAAAYTFNLMDLLPTLDGDKSYGTTTFARKGLSVTGTDYFTEADITENGNTLTVNVKKVETTDESEIATIAYTIETQNYTLTGDPFVAVKTVNKKASTVTAPTAESGVTYDGKAHTGYTGTPSVTGGYTGDLEVTYTDKDGNTSTEAPVNAGTYTITFKVPDSDPEYTGFATAEFTIAPKTLTAVMVAEITGTFIYDGTAKTPDVTVTDGNLLTANDYTVTYQNNIDASPATTRSTGATVEVTGKNNYTGTVTKGFTINPKEITLNWANADNRVYGDGKTVTAEIPADALVTGDTVTVTVTNGDKTAAGTTTATAALEGAAKGNYKLTNGEQEYTIAAKTLTAAMVADITGTFVYDGTAKTPAVTVTDGNLLTANDYTVTYQNNTDAGTATAVVTGKGNYTGTVEVSFTIDTADLSTATAAVEGSFVYNGKDQTPVPTVTLNGKTLTYGKDFTLTYTGNKNTGTVTVKITGKGNYTGTIASLTFTIAKAPLKVTVADLEVPVGGNVVPGLVFDTLQGSDIPEINPAPVFFLYNEKDPDKKEVTPEEAAKKAGTYIIVWKNADNVQFPNLTANYDITVDSTNGTLVVAEQQDSSAPAPDAPDAPTTSNVPDSAYTTCPACGYHNWTETSEGYRCDHCGHLTSTAPTLNVVRTGSYRPAAPGKNVTPVIPQTSDDMPVALLIGLAVVGILGLGVTVIFKKHRNKNK